MHKWTSMSCFNPWHSKMSAALNDFIVKVHFQWVCDVTKYVCQLIRQSCLVVCVNVFLSLAYDIFRLLYDLIQTVSILHWDVSTPADTAKSKHTWKWWSKNICKIWGLISNDLYCLKQYNQMYAFWQWCWHFLSSLNRYQRRFVDTCMCPYARPELLW